MSSEEVLIRAICGNRRSFTTFSIVLIRATSGNQFRLDINGVKGDVLYDDELDAVDNIANEAEKRIGEKRAILRHKYENHNDQYARMRWEIFPSHSGRAR